MEHTKNIGNAPKEKTIIPTVPLIDKYNNNI